MSVLEADDCVGGIARTAEYKGFRFDIGGHRFFTKVLTVQRLWRDLLGDELLTRPRLSRIYFNGRYFAYPLKAVNALAGLGVVQSLAVFASYGWAQLRPVSPELSFEDWVINRFGRRLYVMFFKSYTEKVWGIPCTRIGAQWAAQRIKGLSLWVAAREALLTPFRRGRSSGVRSLIEEFEYPRLGPGQCWDACASRIRAQDGTVELGARVVGVRHHAGRIEAIDVERHGATHTEPVAALISTMPLRTLIEALAPAAPEAVQLAAAQLSYRDFLTVALIVDQADVFPDNWIYVHDASVRVGRIQNFKNWSPAMVPSPDRTCLGLEYFCFEGDGLWAMTDADLVALATDELALLKLVDKALVCDGTVVRMPKAYPIYDDRYLDALTVLRDYVTGFENLQLAGRNGLHKYNNQDHAMVTGLLAAEALCGARVDPWTVNVEDEYLEEGDVYGLAPELADLLDSQPRVPSPIGG